MMKTYNNSLKTLALALLAMATVGCGQKQTPASSESAETAESQDSTAVVAPTQKLDVKKYLEQMSEPDELRLGLGDLELSEYALADVDGDGQDEVWVRDLTHNYMAIYVVNGDTAQLVAYSDGSTELTFYKNAVYYSAYYSPGRSCEGATVVKNSRLGDNFWSEVFFDDEMETGSEDYYVNGKEATEEECEQFVRRLGQPVDAPPLEWVRL